MHIRQNIQEISPKLSEMLFFKTPTESGGFTHFGEEVSFCRHSIIRR